MISADEWERRALSLQAEIEKSLGNLHLTKSDVEDDDFLLLETLNSKPGKYLIDDLSLSDLDDLDIELIGDIDIGEDTEAEKPLKVWPIGYSSLCLKLKRLDALSATPTSYWLEIIVPGLEPIRSRITIPKARSSVSKSIPINLNIVQTISLDIPVESTINFKLFAIAAPSGIPTRTARSSQVSQELWTGFGTLYVKDLLHCPEFKISQTLLLSKETISRFKPSNVLAQIDYELYLVPVKTLAPVIEEQLAGPEIQKSQKEVIKSQPPILHEPVYLHLDITTLDSLSLPVNCDTVWAKFKLTAKDEEIITPSLSILGFLEPRFDFKLNRPIPWSALELMKYPLIIEIHSSAGLLGLVRVPLQNIGKSYMECRKVVGIEETFAIVDIISGEGRGFLGCGIRIGELQSQTRLPLPLSSELHPNEDDSEVAEPVAENIIDLLDEKEDVCDNVSSSDSVLQITIHKATGLASLIESHIPSSPYTDILLLSLDHTPNVYITIDLFGEGDTDSVTSPIVSSFAPGFGYKVEVTVECVDVELVNFLRSGKALGRVWHRVPRHLQSMASEVLLGTFEIDMADLLKGGIRKRWLGVKNEDKVLSGVCLSMSFEGYEVGVCPSITTTFECKYDMQIHGLEGYVNYTAEGRVRDGRLPYKSDQIEFEHDDLEINVYSNNDVFLGTGFIGLASIVQQARNKFRKTQSEMFNETLELEVINAESHEWLGLKLIVNINVYVTRRRRDRSFQKSFLTDTFKESFIHEKESLRDISKIDLVDMDSGFKVADLDQDSITKVIDKVEKDIYHILPQSKVAQKEILKEEQKATVPITITIEKATNLPLMQDPLASSLQSPFVKVSDTKTALANASCSFTLPEQLGGGVWQSAIVQAQSNPNFNFSTTSRLICTQESLDEIKKMFLEFQVYHHLPLSFTSSNSFVSDLEMELVGTVKIDLGALFSMDEIYGWYDLMNGDEGVGQVLIRISPEQSLASIYKELERDASFTGHIDESVVMEEVFEWDGSEWVSKMVARPKIKAKSIDVKQKGNLSLENALGDIQNLHSSMMERFKGLGLNSNSNYKDAKTESDCQSSVAFEGSFYEEECDDSSLSPIGDTGDKRNNHSNPFLDHDQSNSLSEFMNSVEHSDLPLHGDQYLLGGGLEGLEYDTVQIDEPKEISAAGSNLGSLSPLLDSILPPPSISNGNTQETELAKVDYHEEEERSESSSDSFGQSLPMVQSLKSLPQPISEEQDTKIILSQEDILDNDLDSFDGKLSISKSKPPLPPPSIGFKELPPRQDKIYIKSEIEKRLESLSAERSKRIAKILRDN